MSNKGKFRDSNPKIRAAGSTKYNPVNNMKDTLMDVEVQLRLQDDINKSKAKKVDRPQLDSSSKMSRLLYEGYFTKMKELINPAGVGMFQSLLDELQETSYKSYWMTELGKKPDQVPSLPVGMDPENTTFGSPPNRSLPIGSLLNPEKSPEELSKEEDKWHDMYRLTHHHYKPDEQIHYKYTSPKLDTNLTWGQRTYQEPRGAGVRNALQWFDQSKVVIVPKSLAINKALHNHELGRTFEPNNYTARLPQGHAFGKSSQGGSIGVSELLKSSAPSVEAALMNKYLTYINTLRLKLSKRDPPFPFYNFTQEFKHIDPKSCGCLPLEIVYKMCDTYGLSINKYLFLPLLKQANMLNPDNTVNYLGFIRLINNSTPFPELMPLKDLPDELLFFETTYGDLTKDLEKKKEIDSTLPAGLSSTRLDTIYPTYVQSKALISELCGETSVDTLIRPSVFTQYGISHRDFFWPRTKEFIKQIFERIGLSMPDEVFDLLWEEGVKRDNTDGCVCVETFRNILDEVTAAKLAQISF